MGTDEPYSWEADCLRFTATEICTSDLDSSDEACGTWSRLGPLGTESEFTFEIAFEENGNPVRLGGHGRIDDRGKKDSLAAVAVFQMGSQTFNFAIAGRSTNARKCQRILRDFSNSPQMKNPSCYERAYFGDPAESAYILPFSPGSAYEILQSYCTRESSHVNQLAYDFLIPVGVEIIAARGGVVWELREEQPDDGRDCQDHNYVLIQHDDGSVGFYAHLMQDGVQVDEGDRVERGETIALSGNSCTNNIPHLHFGVYSSWPPVEGDDQPVNFVNARGPIDDRGGLMVAYLYRAVDY
jgi:murein DD-endopeptidase MepM/ murein hydrolase activator NlpD